MLNSKHSFRPTKLLVAAAICCASMTAVPAPAAAPCQAGDGCVLPVGRAAPPAAALSPAVYEAERGGKGWLLPVLIGVAALAALYFLVIDDDDEPTSP